MAQAVGGGPIDIFIDVDSPGHARGADPGAVLMKSPSQASTLQRGMDNATSGGSPPRSMNNLESRIKQRQSQMRSEMGNKNAGGITTISAGADGVQAIMNQQANVQ